MNNLNELIKELLENNKFQIVYDDVKGIFNIVVPGNVRFIGRDWEEYNLLDFNFPHILNKKIPGCGYTEYCINTKHTPVILCSPRVMLLDNKFKQHPDIFYYKNRFIEDLYTDKDISKLTRGSTIDATNNLTQDEINKRNKEIQNSILDLENSLDSYLTTCFFSGKIPKILVTYDSFRHVKEYLQKKNILDKFYVVIDEFQSIFTDSRFKSTTELEFVSVLQDIQKLCFVSATPMIDEYLKQIPEFNNLPYFELDWNTENPLRVIKPDLKVRLVRSINSKAIEIIDSYKSGNFEIYTDVNKETGEVTNIVSNEAVFYVNSVKNICDIISKSGLTPEECNILCSNTSYNINKIHKRLGKLFNIGEVPIKGETNKMFTFCTRTVYLGADFYSNCARSFIFSDANIDSLAVDISLDLPQILGRQRLLENPWRNHAEFYYKTLKLDNIQTQEDFNNYIDKKIKNTNSLLRSYQDTRMDIDKHTLAEQYEKLAKILNYKEQYVAVNHHLGKDLVPVFNNLVMISEKRAFDIQQYDYKDRFSVFNTIQNEDLIKDNSSYNIKQFLGEFEKLPNFYYRMKSLCENSLSELELDVILDQIPLTYKQYYELLGKDRCRALGYKKDQYDKYISDSKFNKEDLIREVQLVFQVGQRYTKNQIKETLKNIYDSLGYNKSPKANDIEEYFEVKRSQIPNKTTGKKDEGYLILSIKD